MTADEGDRTSTAKFMSWFGVIFLVCLVILLLGCGQPPDMVAEPPETTAIVVVKPELPLITTIAAPASSNLTAIRLDPPEPPPFDAIGHVNGLPYQWQNMIPAMEAWRVTALSRGWAESAVAAWTPFVYDVIIKESGGCPNVRGGDLFVVGTCDQYQRHGHGEDSGFGQVTYALYGPTAILCVHEGICSQREVNSSPYVSMTALVATIERLGRQPWCWSAWARGFHDCGLAP